MKYQDMLDLPRPPSRRPKMQRQDRAKIFAPFAALSGHSEAVHARETVLVPRAVLTPTAQEVLDKRLRDLRKGDFVTAIWFVPVSTQGEEPLGQYVTAAGVFQKMDVYGGMLYLENQTVPLKELAELRCSKTNG